MCYSYVYMCVYVCTYVYTYLQRGRERERTLPYICVYAVVARDSILVLQLMRLCCTIA